MTTYTLPIADMGFVMAEVAVGDISAIIANIFFANLPVELMEEAGWLAIPLFFTDRLPRAGTGGVWVGAMAAMAPRGAAAGTPGRVQLGWASAIRRGDDDQGPRIRRSARRRRAGARRLPGRLERL